MEALQLPAAVRLLLTKFTNRKQRISYSVPGIFITSYHKERRIFWHQAPKYQASIRFMTICSISLSNEKKEKSTRYVHTRYQVPGIEDQRKCVCGWELHTYAKDKTTKPFVALTRLTIGTSRALGEYINVHDQSISATTNS